VYADSLVPGMVTFVAYIVQLASWPPPFMMPGKLTANAIQPVAFHAAD
jgi:hypothetical protein